jgi:hypothetical protein
MHWKAKTKSYKFHVEVEDQFGAQRGQTFTVMFQSL